VNPPPRLFLLPSLISLAGASIICAAETTLTDSEGLTAWVRTPSEKPDPVKTYQLVVGGHDVGAPGKRGPGVLAGWKDLDDVIIRGAAFASLKTIGQAARRTVIR
jgi:hypothetical protein